QFTLSLYLYIGVSSVAKRRKPRHLFVDPAAVLLNAPSYACGSSLGGLYVRESHAPDKGRYLHKRRDLLYLGSWGNCINVPLLRKGKKACLPFISYVNLVKRTCPLQLGIYITQFWEKFQENFLL
ncbi:MAG: hypothetical protein D6710_11480, partial [Nitrospirae bacterium]